MTHETTQFSLNDAIEVLRLLDGDPDAGFEVRRGGLRVQCVRGTKPPATGGRQVGDVRKEAAPSVLLRAPAVGRFHGDAAVFASGARPIHVKVGTVVGRIEAGTHAIPVTSSVDGTVAHACVAPDGFVEYGQTLLAIDVA